MPPPPALRPRLSILPPNLLPCTGRSPSRFFPARSRPLSLRRGGYCLRAAQGEAGTATWPDESDEELRRLLELLPGELRLRVEDHPELPALVEVVMDLGRPPLARFPSGDFLLSHRPISFDDLRHATSQVQLRPPRLPCTLSIFFWPI
jgi:hypothetical protein